MSDNKCVVSTYVSGKQKETIVKAAKANGQSVSGYIKFLIRQDLSKPKQLA